MALSQREQLDDHRLAALSFVEIYRIMGNENPLEKERTRIEVKAKADAAFERLL